MPTRDPIGPKRDRNLIPTRDFPWTAKSEQAALLVAEDRLTNERIAAECGISRRTLDSWRTHPAFAARVDGHVAAFAETVRRSGIGRLENRVRRLNATWNGLQDVISARAAAVADKSDYHLQGVPGAETGLLVVTYKAAGGRVVKEIQTDTATLGELRAVEQQAAKELGQWTEKKDVTSGGERLPSGPDLRHLSGERLALLEEILQEAEGAGTSQPSGG